MIRIATIEDKDIILRIAHQYSKELGYLHPVGLIDHIKKNTVLVGVVGGEIAGFVDYNAPKRGENAGYSVIYHLAIDKLHRGNGLGRALLYAVPAPIRLKCTVDNSANTFYQKVGMQLIKTEQGKKRALNFWQMNILNILIRGGNKTVPEIARKTGWAYGSRHDMSIYEWPFMVDINWQKYDWQKYLTLLHKWRPVQAMVADYEHPDQKNLMLSQVADLRRLGILRILVCPKFESAINDIPNDCIVAISTPTKSNGKYKGYLPPLSLTNGRKVHLLGGSPQKQASLITRIHAHGGVVISQDSNSHMDSRRITSVFESGVWKSIKYERHTIEARSIYSGINIRKWLNDTCDYRQHVMDI